MAQPLTEKVKGICENCGYAFEGTIPLKDGVYPNIKCPGGCGQEPQNFDEASDVDALNAEDAKEGMQIPAYNHVEKFEVVEDFI